ncbi:MAG: hypothetical protein ABFS12_01355 [Bacteroidota bacterium]
MVKAIPYLFKKIYPTSWQNYSQRSIHFKLITKLLFLTFFLSLFGTDIVGQVVIREKIILENIDTSWYKQKSSIKKLLKTDSLFPGIVSDFTGEITLQFAYADQIYGTLSPDSKVIIETKDTLIEHYVLSEFETTDIYYDGSAYDICLEQSIITTIAFYYNAPVRSRGWKDPERTTIELNVEKGDSIKIVYETYVPKNQRTEIIPLSYTMRGFLYQWIQVDGIWVKKKLEDYTYINYSKYYGCIYNHWYTELDIYAFEYPNSQDSIDHFNIEIKPDSLINGIKVAKKDTVAFTELASLYIKAMDADSNATELDSTKLLRFEITTNTKYGTFIKPNGDTLKTTPIILANITYADAKNGKVKFAAVKANPKSVVKCKIKVSLQDDVTTKGEKEAVVLEQTLKIVMKGEKEVKVNTSNITILANATLKRLQDYRKPFFVSLTRGGKHLGNHKFKIFTNFVPGSGGHNHSNPRTTITDNKKYWNYGHFRKTKSPKVLANPLNDSTTVNYLKDEYNYFSSRWGDIMKIILISKKNNLLTDTLLITEKVLNLVQLEPGENYKLIGGTCYHHGPSDKSKKEVPDSCRTPDNNHFGTADVVNRIKRIAKSWDKKYSEKEIILEINDMSLPFGGKFDYKGNWEAPHSSHREGVNVDIRSYNITISNNTDYYVDINKNGVYDKEIDEFHKNTGGEVPSNYKFIDDLSQGFRAICQDKGAKPVLEYPNKNNEHFHLNFK